MDYKLRSITADKITGKLNNATSSISDLIGKLHDSLSRAKIDEF